jgi:hypothetical protein
MWILIECRINYLLVNNDDDDNNNNNINTFSFAVALRPNARQGLLVHEVSRSQTTTQHSR